jgi:valacyclovir hydrolase
MAWFEYGTSRIYYEEEGGGDPVLLIPGLTMGIGDMTVIRQALVPAYRVIAADAPGSGQSRPQPRRYSGSYYQDDSRAFLALLAELRASPAHVVGFSDGGEYALVMAETNVAAVRSIVAWGAVGIAPPKEAVAAFEHVIDDPIPPMQGYSSYLKATYGEQNARLTVQSAAQAWHEMGEAGGDISRKRADQIACPALLITGENDFLAPPAAVADLASAMQKAEFIEAKGAGHAVHHEQADWLVSVVVDWLAGQ